MIINTLKFSLNKIIIIKTPYLFKVFSFGEDLGEVAHNQLELGN